VDLTAVAWFSAVIAVLFVAAVLVTLRSKAIWRLSVLFSTYLSLPAGLPLLASSSFSILSGPAIVSRAKSLVRSPVLSALTLLLLVSISAMLWTDPNSYLLGLKRITSILGVLISIATARAASQDDGDDLLTLTMRLTAPLALIQAASVFVFALSSQVEELYLRSAIGAWLTGGRAPRLFTDWPDNVIGLEKSGGILFVNGNEASMVMAVWSLLLFAIWVRRSESKWFWLATIVGLSSIATGSKTAIVLWLILPIVAVLLPHWLNARTRARMIGVGLLVLPIAFIASYQVFISSESFRANSEVSSSQRASLWDAAVRLIASAPATGVGFGSWYDWWAPLVSSYNAPLDARLPPHNFFLYTGVEIGLIGVAALVVVFVVHTTNMVVGISSAVDLKESRARSLELGAMLWIFFHGMFDTTSFFGVAQTIPVFSLMVARGIEFRSRDRRARRLATNGNHKIVGLTEVDIRNSSAIGSAFDSSARRLV
jgi:O-antigen ligase